MSWGDARSLTAAAASRWITNPKQLPVAIVNEANLSLKTSATVTNNFTAVNSATSFTAMALRGAQTSVAVADTYVTLANLTGSGFLFNVICATNTGAGYTPTIRITVDGTIYTISSSSTVNATFRLVLGALISAAPSVSAIGAVGTDIISPNAGPDNGFSGANVGGLYNPATASIMTPEMILAYGLPCLRFETSLIVEMKASLLASSANDRIGGVSYRLDT
jgi:hypothetical protein